MVETPFTRCLMQTEKEKQMLIHDPEKDYLRFDLIMDGEVLQKNLNYVEALNEVETYQTLFGRKCVLGVHIVTHEEEESRVEYEIGLEQEQAETIYDERYEA